MSGPAPGSASPVAERLRQMIAVLQAERQALAAMDLEGLMMSAQSKQSLCSTLEGAKPSAIDAECEGLLITARQLNEVNRRVRNLLAVNVAARLDALTGSTGLYHARGNRHGRRLKSA